MGRDRSRYQMRRDTDEFYSVVDGVTGAPADVGATSIQLTKLEAQQLLERLQAKAYEPALEPPGLANPSEGAVRNDGHRP